MKLEFIVKGQELIRKEKKPVANFVRNHLKCSFCFDENWIDLKKYALFVDAENNKFVSLLGFGKNLFCTIPEEVTKGNYFRVSVFADELLTSTQQTILLYPSLYDLDVDDVDMDENEDSQDISDNDYEDSYRKNYDDEWCRIPNCKQFIRDEHPFDD